jgi:hypothetical protein
MPQSFPISQRALVTLGPRAPPVLLASASV